MMKNNDRYEGTLVSLFAEVDTNETTHHATLVILHMEINMGVMHEPGIYVRSEHHPPSIHGI